MFKSHKHESKVCIIFKSMQIKTDITKRFHTNMSRFVFSITGYCTFSIARFRAIFNSHEMKSYAKPNVIVDFLDIETCSSIGKVVLQLPREY